ncbi:hypothetical protein [Streptococcus parauberis]|uniref:hypothetical protein n=1 Tax=Streptococcus parauberis TaxID=1348 RepID=UPI0037A56BC2
MSIDDLEKNLNKLSKNAEKISGTSKIKFDELFSNDFMKKNTKFNSIEEFLLASPEKISNTEEFEASDESVLDGFVSEQTKFNSWEDFYVEAYQELIAKKLGL